MVDGGGVGRPGNFVAVVAAATVVTTIADVVIITTTVVAVVIIVVVAISVIIIVIIVVVIVGSKCCPSASSQPSTFHHVNRLFSFLLRLAGPRVYFETVNGVIKQSENTMPLQTNQRSKQYASKFKQKCVVSVAHQLGRVFSKQISSD